MLECYIACSQICVDRFLLPYTETFPVKVRNIPKNAAGTKLYSTEFFMLTKPAWKLFYKKNRYIFLGTNKFLSNIIENFENIFFSIYT